MSFRSDGRAVAPGCAGLRAFHSSPGDDGLAPRRRHTGPRCADDARVNPSPSSTPGSGETPASSPPARPSLKATAHSKRDAVSMDETASRGHRRSIPSFPPRQGYPAERERQRAVFRRKRKRGDSLAVPRQLPPGFSRGTLKNIALDLKRSRKGTARRGRAIGAGIDSGTARVPGIPGE